MSKIMWHLRPALFFAAIAVLAIIGSGCTPSGTLAPGDRVAPPWGMESLCVNNPEECASE